MLPVAPPSTAKLRAADLALLEEDARRFVVRDRPAADALWLALLKPKDRILQEAAYIRSRAKLIAEGANAGLQDPMGATLGGPAALVSVAEVVVERALLGDLHAAEIIFDRIEGRATPRKLDEGDAAQSRADMVAGIEAVVRAMNERPGDKALDVTPSKANGHAFGGKKPNGEEPEIP